MCTKPCSVLIISFRTKWMTRFQFYPSSDYEHYQLMKLHEFEARYPYCGKCIMWSQNIISAITTTQIFLNDIGQRIKSAIINV